MPTKIILVLNMINGNTGGDLVGRAHRPSREKKEHHAFVGMMLS
jgi:hypothetical protein